MNGGKNPVWSNQIYTFHKDPHDHEIQIEVWELDTVGSDDLVGSTIINASDYETGGLKS